MRFALLHPSEWFPRKSLWADLKAGVVLGVEGVPDNLSSGVLAAINPMAAVYAGIFGVAGAAFFSSSALMPAQSTGAMAIIVRDIGVGSLENPAGALATLTLLTGLFMLIAGLLRLGTLVRFVSRSVVTGFIAAVGVNIILGQFYDITQVEAEGGRIAQAVSTVAQLGRWNWATVAVAAATVVAILVLRRTRLGGLGYVVAIVIAWLMAFYFNRSGTPIQTVGDIADVPSGMPLPILPDLGQLLPMLVPALSITFVGLVQGAGVAASVRNPDGSPTNASQDFIAQGAGNIASGFFRGMPVGGSASGAVLMQTAGAQSRGALFFTSITMALLVVAAAPLVALVPLCGLAGMLLVVGADTIPQKRVMDVFETGPIPIAVMAATFVLTMLIPLQYAVLVGVAVSMLLFVIGESARLDLKQIVEDRDGGLREVDPPEFIGSHEVIVIQPYGTVFFASAEPLIHMLPKIGPDSHRSVLILRLRGEQSPSSTLIDQMARYADDVEKAGCRLIVVSSSKTLVENLTRAEVVEQVVGRGVYRSTDRLGVTLRRAYEDAQAWIENEPKHAN